MSMSKIIIALLCLLPVALMAQADTLLRTSAIDYALQVKPGLDSNSINYSSLGLKMKIDYDDKASQQSFSTTTRLRKDSLLWMALIGPLNIEVARVAAKPDSFTIMNKIGEEYVVRPISFLQDWLYMPLNFSMLQQVLAGQVIDITPAAIVTERQDSSIVVYFESDKIQEKVVLNSESYTIRQIVLKDKMIQQNMVINFEAYNLLDSKPFSYKRSIEITRGTYLLKMNIDITRATVNEALSYPFEIPERYKRVP